MNFPQKSFEKFFLVSLLLFLLHVGNAFAKPLPYQTRFEEICTIVESSFWNEKAIEEIFKREKSMYQEKLPQIKSEEDFAHLVNSLLETLETSHTNYYIKTDQEYFLLGDVFQGIPEVKKAFGNKSVRYPSIGIFSRKIDGKTFVFSVMEGSPAQKARVNVGDELLFADGKPFSPVVSFLGKAGKPVKLDIRRDVGSPSFQIEIIPEMVNPKDEFMKALKASRKIIPYLGKKIAYIHVWSYAGQEFHDEFLDALASEEFADADALIWDLRDGLGGANPQYLNVFNQNIPAMKFQGRDGEVNISDSQWRKPMVMLINNRVRSGKEILAFGVKKYRLGTLIGERTAGAVIGGRLFRLSDNSFMFLAVSGGTVDGEILEGAGVSPDLEVPRPIPYCNGRDPQLTRALDFLTKPE